VFGRNGRSRTHTQQLVDELMESYDHLRLAAGHAAGSAAERVVPPYDRARGVASRGLNTTRGTIGPLYGQVRDGATIMQRGRRVPKRRRWPMLVGLLAAGTAVGAVAAMMARQRQTAAQWDDFEPLPSIDDLGYRTGSPPGGRKMAAGAASMADSAANQAGRIADALHERAERDSNGRPPAHP
jgi:hypothetical protein